MFYVLVEYIIAAAVNWVIILHHKVIIIIIFKIIYNFNNKFFLIKNIINIKITDISLIILKSRVIYL